MPRSGDSSRAPARSLAPLNPRDRILERIALRRIEVDRLVPDGARVLVAVSGGPDSVALVHFLTAEHRRNGRPAALAVGHVDHGLRGADSAGDAVFVERFAERLDVPCFTAKLPEGALGPPRADSLASEERARLLRYEALRNLAREAGASRIALAHTADDQAETVLFRMARGAGLRGLAGMSSRARIHGAHVIRPLLDVSRGQVLEYLQRHGLDWREDATNESRGATRNYLRHEILPRLRERVNPAVQDALRRQADLFRELDGYLSAEARRAFPEVIHSAEPGKIVLDARRLLSYPKLLRSYIFRCALHDLDGVAREVSAAHVDVLHSLATQGSGRSADFPLGVRVRRERGRIVLAGRNGEPTGSGTHPTVETSGIPADSRKGSPAE
ncbi:MAG: tRNA lysidine(34) synthetase TilS [Bacteroidota bacterium]